LVIVAGATGYIGRFVVQALREAGHSIRCLVRDRGRCKGLDGPDISCETVDLECEQGLSKALAGGKSLVSAAHIRFAPQLIHACRAAGVRRAVFLSSTWLFSKLRTKEVSWVVAGEEAVQTSGLDTTVFRLAMTYGPGDDRNISRLRDFVRRHRVFPTFGDGKRLVQPVYVSDVVGAVTSVLNCCATVGKAYQLAGPYPMTYDEMVATVCRATGRSVLSVYLPITLALPGVWIYERISRAPKLKVDQVIRLREDRAFDISESQRDLGFRPMSFEEGLREAMRINGEDTR